MSHPTDAADESAPLPLPRDRREPWPSFLRAMFWIGLNTFGGPVAQIGVMHRETVEKRRWLSDGQFVHLLNFANILPGPEALEVCIHLGYLRRGILGGIVAGLLFIWPGFVSLSLLGWIYLRYGDVAAVTSFMNGIRPVALALVAAAAVRIARRSLEGSTSYVLMAASFVASYLLRVPFLAILGGCGLLGLLLGRYRRTPDAAKKGGRRGWLFALLVVALVGGSEAWHRLHPPSAPATPAAATTAATAVSAGARRAKGPERSFARLRDIAWLNMKTALITFGGAYTALPYLREQSVGHYGWLEDRQVMDALALGETTPGPLICIAVFISYLAGGFAGAVVGTFFLFLPSFLLVLGLGRFIERIEKLPHARSVLWGFSAGTLGLIVALASTLVASSIPDLMSGAIALAAFIAVWRFDVNLLLLVLAGGAIGWLRAWL